MTRADWIHILAVACETRSQKRVADAIGYSAAVVNQVLKGTYKGDLGAVEQAVRGALMHACVQCPVAGELPAHKCLEFQRQKFAATNPQRVQMFRACRNGCSNYRKEEAGK